MRNTLTRIGRFSISTSLLDDPEPLLILFAQVVIYRADMDYCSDKIEYKAYSPLFDLTDRCDSLPEYQAILNTIAKTVKFKKIK